MGGFVAAGGFGPGSRTAGGFSNNVAELTMVDGRGRLQRLSRDEALIPWLFGAMGQLGIVVEAQLEVTVRPNAAPLAGIEKLASTVRVARDYRFWFTPRPRSRGTIHADGYHNLNAQIGGRKEWILQSPEQHRNGEALTCCTEAGEILYIPKSCWHAATALEPSINVNAWHTIPS